MFTLIKFLNKLSEEDRVAGIKFLITSLRNSANEGCEKVWKELRRDYASGTTPAQHFNNNIIDEFDKTNELDVVKWSIDHGSIVQTQRNNNIKISGQFNHSLIPCSATLNAANTRRNRDQTLIFETKFQELMQLFLYRVNCPVYRHFEYKENANNEVVVWTDKSDKSFSASLTEIGDDDLLIDDQSTRQTDDIMDDDSQTGDASIEDGGSSEQAKDDKKTNVKKKKPKHKAKVTSWTCFQCPKV